MNEADIIKAVAPPPKPAPTIPQDTFPKGYENTPGGVYVPRDVGTVIPQGYRDKGAAYADTGAETLPLGFKRLDNGMLVNTGKSTLTGTIYPSRVQTNPHDSAIPLPIPKQDELASGPGWNSADYDSLNGAYPSPAPEFSKSSNYVIARGTNGEPLLTNAPDAQAATLFPLKPGDPLRPSRMQITPLETGETLPRGVQLNYREGDYDALTGNRKSLRSLEGTGTGEGGGQVIQPVLDAETQKLVDARKAQTLPALNSLNQTLGEANLMESAHGPQQARQAQALIAAQRERQMEAFSKKWGVDLKAMELQATLPKLAAESEYYKAHARQMDNQSNKSAYAQGLSKIMENAQAVMLKPKDIMESEEEYKTRIEQARQTALAAHDELINHEKQATGKTTPNASASRPNGFDKEITNAAGVKGFKNEKTGQIWYPGA